MGRFFLLLFEFNHGETKEGYYENGKHHYPYRFYAHLLSSSLGNINQPATADNMATAESPMSISIDTFSCRKLPITPTVIVNLETSIKASPNFLLLSTLPIISGGLRYAGSHHL